MPRSFQLGSSIASFGERIGATTHVIGASRPCFEYSRDISTSCWLVYLLVSSKTSADHFSCSSLRVKGATLFQRPASHSSHFPTISANACHISSLRPPRNT